MAIATEKLPGKVPAESAAVRRILMTADTLGGVWQYALELIDSLAAYEIEVGLATMGRLLSPDQRRDADRLPNLTLFESSWRLEWMEEPWSDTRSAGRWLIDLEKYFEPDLVHLNNYVHGSWPFRAPVLVVGHSCVFSWFEAVKGHLPPEKWQRYENEVGRGLRASPLVVAPTTAMLQSLCRHYGLPAQGSVLQVIYNGRRSHEFHASDKEPFIFSAGRLWDEAKNVQALARVAPDLEWPVRVAGETAHPASGASALENVELVGRLDAKTMADQFSRTAIYALPARYEPFGLSALEAGLSGCALVLGDIPTLREIWNDAALYVQPDDHEGLAEALGRLIGDRELREAMAGRAHRRALGFSSERMVRSYLDAYASLRVRS